MMDVITHVNPANPIIWVLSHANFSELSINPLQKKNTW